MDADELRWVVYDAEDEAVEPAGGGDAASTKTIISFCKLDKADRRKIINPAWRMEGQAFFSFLEQQ